MQGAINRIRRLALGMLLAGFAVTSQAQHSSASWPTRPIRIVVPFTAGGSTDIVARQLAEKIRPALGQPVVIENKPGAGGTLGTDLVAKSPPDGHTLLVIPGAHAINASLYSGLPYDTLKDFAPVIQIAMVASMVVVHPSVPAKSIEDLVQLAKAKPGTINYGSAGAGTVTHMSGELFNLMSGASLQHVPYKGSSQALTDLVGGQVQVMFANFPGTLQHVQAGRLRALAVNGTKRSPLLPETPTVSENGVPGYDANTWYGVLAPAGTPGPIIARLNQVMAQALEAEDLRRTLATEGGEVVAGTPEQFGKFLRADIEKWSKVVDKSGARRNLK